MNRENFILNFVTVAGDAGLDHCHLRLPRQGCLLADLLACLREGVYNRSNAHMQ